jgi:hypothetical protein|tara:strand:+ start:429 stop:650 length:222 start_codon:yes stop_codon:yes gene_type:complete
VSKDNISKVVKAILILKSNAEFSFVLNEITTEEHFNQIRWKTGEDSNGMSIDSTTCPHSEITWAKVKEEMDKL